MKLGKTLLEDRAPGEVNITLRARVLRCWGRSAANWCRRPTAPSVSKRCRPHGGWLGSAEDLVRFGAVFNRPAKCKILSEKSITDLFARPEGAPGWAAPGRLSAAYYGCGWYVRPIGRSGDLNTWHTGSLPGTRSLLVRRFDGMTWAVLINSREGENGVKVIDELDPLLHEAANVYLLAGK